MIVRLINRFDSSRDRYVELPVQITESKMSPEFVDQVGRQPDVPSFEFDHYRQAWFRR